MPDSQFPSVEPFDPAQGDLERQHVLYPSQIQDPETEQQLISAGWMPCPRCHQSWLSPENKEALQASHGYYTCPHARCRQSSDIMDNLPWHGVEEEEYYPQHNTGGGTSIGIPMTDMGQIAENLIYEMHEIPGYGPITWWHGSAGEQSPLDGATAEWGIEVKACAYDAASHFYHPGGHEEAADKASQASEMGLQGVLGLLVMLNFRNDRADIYLRAMPLTGGVDQQGRPTRAGAFKWHKKNGVKIASDLPFSNPYKDPNHPAPGPYSLETYYDQPKPAMTPTQTIDPDDWLNA